MVAWARYRHSRSRKNVYRLMYGRRLVVKSFKRRTSARNYVQKSLPASASGDHRSAAAAVVELAIQQWICAWNSHTRACTGVPLAGTVLWGPRLPQNLCRQGLVGDSVALLVPGQGSSAVGFRLADGAGLTDTGAFCVCASRADATTVGA